MKDALGDERYRIGRADFVLELVRDGRRGAGTGRRLPAASFSAMPRGYWLNSSCVTPCAPMHASPCSGCEPLGLEPLIASGDRAAVVAGIARQLDGPRSLGNLRAADKLACVRSLQAQRHIVAMVGDGVNDAPVLAGADVSVAIGGGTDLAKVSADIVMLGEDLAPLAQGIETARRCMRIIRQNIAWAVIYNAAAVPLAASGWLQPWMAAIGMSTSSLLVTLNALRLLRPPTAAAGSDLPLRSTQVSPA